VTEPCVPKTADGWWPSSPTDLHLRELFAVNILLQLVDGVLTYRAEMLGFYEGNPLVSASMGTLGFGSALLLFKAHACGLLLLLRRSAPPSLGAPALWATAIGYLFFAVVPWLGKFTAFALY
jgi:hypothetical protein